MARSTTLGRFAVLVGLAVAGVPGCGAGKPEPQTSFTEQQDEKKADRLLVRAREAGGEDRFRQIVVRFPNTKAAGEAREALAKLLVAAAEKALEDKDWVTAEDKAEEAKIHAGLQVTERARAVLDKIDDNRAATVAEEAGSLAAEGKCASALKKVAATLRKKPRDRYKKEVQKLSQVALLGCINGKLEEEMAAGNVEAARQMIETPDATTALSSPGYALAAKSLLKLIVQKSLSGLAPTLKDHKWAEAFAKLDEMKGKSELSDKEYAAAVEIVQDAVQKHLLEFMRSALTGADPAAAAKSVEEQITASQWKRPPDDVTKLQATLAIAVECQRVGCKMGSPSVAWAWGSLDITTPASTEGEAVGKVKHAQKFWVLGRAKTHALIITADPGKLAAADAFDKATGWVSTDHLRTTDTDMWLPPTEQLVGTRVWGPLRAKDALYYLGTVTKIDGNKATVKRMADGIEEVVDAMTLRVGKLPKGLKVIAFCADELHPEEAKVEGVEVEGDTPKVNVSCNKGKKSRVEVAGSLTSKPDWLPPRKP